MRQFARPQSESVAPDQFSIVRQRSSELPVEALAALLLSGEPATRTLGPTGLAAA